MKMSFPTNNVAQYKFQNNNCIVTFLDKHKNASPEKLHTTVQHSKVILLYSPQVTT